MATRPARSTAIVGIADRIGDWLLAHATLLLALSVAVLAVRVLLVPDPILMSDEYYYAKTTQLWAMQQQDARQITGIEGRGEAGFPNALFFAIYRVAYAFGDNFYTVAKLLNVAFALVTALAVERVGAFFLERRAATLIAALALWLPSTGYLAYFMPEALYESLVWWGLAAFLMALPRDQRLASAALGALLGAAMLAKPNAAAVLVAANGVVALIAWRCLQPPQRLSRALQALLALNLAFVATGYVLNLALTGHLRWDPMGTFYKAGLAQLAVVEGNAGFASDFTRYALVYVYALLIAFGPVALVLIAGPSPARDARTTALWGFATIGVMALLLGSAKVGVNWERVYVGHMAIYSTRYMSVLFPLLVIAFWRFAPLSAERRTLRRVAGLALGVGLIVLTFAYRDIGNPTQLPEIFGTRHLYDRLFKPTMAAALLVTLYMAFAHRPAARVYAAFLFVFVGLSAAGVLKEDFRRAHDWQAKVYSDAARTVRALVPPDRWDRGRVVTATSSPASRFMLLFPGIVPVQLAPKNSTLARDAIAGAPDWVVFLDTVRPGFDARCIRLEEATLCALADGALR